jgi:hypothetical protein
MSSLWNRHAWTHSHDDDEFIKASVIFRKGKTVDDEICVCLSPHPALYLLTLELVSYFREAYYESKFTNTSKSPHLTIATWKQGKVSALINRLKGK